jgi:hypothetical protein
VPLSIYCSGSIKKGPDDDTGPLWGDEERASVQAGAGQPVVFLNPDDPIIDPGNTLGQFGRDMYHVDPGNTLGQFGRDMYQVMIATAVVVDARVRRGIGVGVEMAAAGILGTPVIVVAPKNSQYRKDSLHYRGVSVTDYVHPHVAVIAWAVVDDFESAGQELAGLPRSVPADHELPVWLSQALAEYSHVILPCDQPMLEAVRKLDIPVPFLQSAGPS